MEAKAFQLTSSATLALSPPFLTTPLTLSTSKFNFNSVGWVRLGVVCRSKKAKEKEQQLNGLPKEYYDDEWQARQREKTKELHQMRQEEEDEEERKIDEYREIGLRLKDYPEEEIRKVKKLVSSFIRSAEEVEEKIEEAAEKGELTELVLMVIWNRLDLARRDDEKDAVRSLDLLYRRVEALLHFMYWDSLPDFEELTGLNSQWASTVMFQHLLGAADQYGLERLRLLCEASLCDGVAVDTVATTLALSEQHYCFQLKSVCLKFVAMPKNLRGEFGTHNVESSILISKYK